MNQIIHKGQFTGKERGYSSAYPETENVVYNVYMVNDKEYGLPVKSSLKIEDLLKKEVL